MKSECHSAIGSAYGGKHSAFCMPGRSASAEPGILNSSFSSAFTLIELVVTIVIIGIIALVTVQYLVSACQVYAMLLAKNQADSELMTAVDTLRREARTARSNLTATTNQWKFINVQGLTNIVTNTFLRTGSEVTMNSNCLARGVGRFGFTYYDSTNGVLAPVTNYAAIKRVELSFNVTNEFASSETIINVYVRAGFLK